MDTIEIIRALKNVASDAAFVQIRDHFTEQTSEEGLTALAAEYHERTATLSPVLPNQTLAVALNNPMTAALCFDRVWWGVSPIPSSIGFGGLDPAEISIVGVIDIGTSNLPDIDLNNVDPALALSSRRIAERASGKITLGIAKLYDRRFNLDVVPVYGSMTSRDAEFEAGAHDVAIASLMHVALVDEDALTWDQVMQFREDKESVKKYRLLIHWLERDLIGRSAGFLEAEMGRRLDDYQWALRKHGINTVVGALSEILNPKWLTGATAFGALTAYASQDPLFGAGGAIAVTAGRVAIAVCRSTLAKEDIRRANREIALVHELRAL